MTANNLNKISTPRYARAAGAAIHFSVSKSTIWNWTKNRTGFPAPFKAGERVTLFDLGAIDAYLKNGGCEK